MVLGITLQYFVQQLINALVLSGYYALIAVGLTVIFGTLDIINFAHGGFYMLGAYATVILGHAGLPYVAAAFGAILVTMAAGTVVERTVAKPLRDSDELTMLLATLGLFLAMQAGARLLFGTNTREITVPWNDVGFTILGGYTLTLQRLLVPLVAVAVLAGFHLFMNRTKTGMMIRATAEDRRMASVMGVNTDRYMLGTFAVGTGMAGLAGAVVGPTTVVSYTMGFWPTLVGFIIITIGGMGSYKGAIVAALLIGLVEGLGQIFISSTWARALIFLLLLVVLVVQPQGFFGNDIAGASE